MFFENFTLNTPPLKHCYKQLNRQHFRQSPLCDTGYT